VKVGTHSGKIQLEFFEHGDEPSDSVTTMAVSVSVKCSTDVFCSNSSE
jgi:hypothetical protein